MGHTRGPLDLTPVVQTMDSAIRPINHYPSFEQLWPAWYRSGKAVYEWIVEYQKANFAAPFVITKLIH